MGNFITSLLTYVDYLGGYLTTAAIALIVGPETYVTGNINIHAKYVRTKIAQSERKLINIGWWLTFILKIICLILSVCCAGYCEDRAKSSNLWLYMNYMSMFSIFSFASAIMGHIFQQF